jgi:hypothetical protein
MPTSLHGVIIRVLRFLSRWACPCLERFIGHGRCGNRHIGHRVNDMMYAVSWGLKFPERWLLTIAIMPRNPLQNAMSLTSSG